MSISSISPAFSLAGATATSSPAQQRRSDFRQLAQDLQSGNLSGAQSTYQQLTQNAGPQPADNNSPAAQAFQALGQQLQSGNLQGAQQAFANFQQAVSSNPSSAPQPPTEGTHRGHHGHHHEDQDTTTSTTPPATTTATGTTTPVSGGTINLTA
jgi:hypothetical protein